MPERRPPLSRADAPLVFWAVLLGLAAAAVFAVYRAVSLSDEDAAARMGEFAANLFWPGAIIFAAVAAVIFFGWKANLD